MLTNRKPLAWLPIYVLICVTLTACGKSGASEADAENVSKIKDEIETQYLEVHELHDVVMPMRTDLISALRKIKESPLDTAMTAFAKTRLERADDLMMNWMYNDEPLENMVARLGPDMAKQHLALRKKEINYIGDSMRLAIEYAKEFQE